MLLSSIPLLSPLSFKYSKGVEFTRSSGYIAGLYWPQCLCMPVEVLWYQCSCRHCESLNSAILTISIVGLLLCGPFGDLPSVVFRPIKEYTRAFPFFPWLTRGYISWLWGTMHFHTWCFWGRFVWLMGWLCLSSGWCTVFSGTDSLVGAILPLWWLTLSNWVQNQNTGPLQELNMHCSSAEYWRFTCQSSMENRLMFLGHLTKWNPSGAASSIACQARTWDMI